MGETPKLTAIVCAKRHHVRFYPYEKKTSNGNCLPGTYVDDVVTSPYYTNFYLQSHAPLQGTARPAHYFILRNDMDKTVEELRQFVSINDLPALGITLIISRLMSCASHTCERLARCRTLPRPTTLIDFANAVVATSATSSSTLQKAKTVAMGSASKPQIRPGVEQRRHSTRQDLQ